jgi:hypothetical protein
MSKVIQAIEDFQKSVKGNGYAFQATEDTFIFNLDYKPKISHDDLISKMDKVSEQWKYEKELPVTFKDKGKVVMFVNLNMGIMDLLKHRVAVSGFSIPSYYEKAGELADYMLELFKPEK